MISNLLIENYALINRANIDFNSGFSVITGETGAGKSIMLGALSLVIGARADISVLRDKSSKCIVELTCNIDKYNLKEFFTQSEIDYDEICIIRREILPSGKSRAFINDSPVNLKQLKDLGFNLIDIHSQNQTQILMDSEYQISVVDSFAKLSMNDYKRGYRELVNLQIECNTIKELAQKESADLDYFQFQFNQLEEAQLVSGEKEELEKELEMLSHSEEIKSALVSSHNIMDGEENSVLSSLKIMQSNISRISEYYESADLIVERLNSVYIELQDISSEFEKSGGQVEYDPARIEWINNRLGTIYNLLKKHKFDTEDELIDLKDELDGKLQNISSYDDTISELEHKIKEKKDELLQIAEDISQKRHVVLPEIESVMDSLLVELGIVNAAFRIKTHKIDLNINGIDDICFMFSANKNSELQEIGKVASGGEMSRLMLSLKYLICESRQLPSIIFDEIDTGVSGSIAERMAYMMKNMSNSMQVISITHLPQIAAKGDWHYKVFKNDNEETTHSNIKLLDEESRLEEIAKMLSGSNISEAAFHNARALIQN